MESDGGATIGEHKAKRINHAATDQLKLADARDQVVHPLAGEEAEAVHVHRELEGIVAPNNLRDRG